MEKMLKDALDKQKLAGAEAERAAQQAGGRPATAAGSREPAPLNLASVQPTPGAKPATLADSAKAEAAGDEWEYVATDIYGKKQTLIERVKAIVPGAGVLEEFVLGGRPQVEWVFDNKPRLVGIPTDSVMLFAPSWSGDNLDGLAIINPSRCTQLAFVTGCRVLKVAVVGDEKITVPAGGYDTKKIQITLIFTTDYGDATLDMSVWYSKEHKRMVRQSVKGRHPMTEAHVNSLYETMELAAYRSWARR